ncbi:hypothetical protein, partial [Pseudomonas viridiflava]|uniref:hypothetical protein n=3 Tax=Pseudomonas viridiflava TaxID=33069 RepID=UPI001980BF9F
NIHRLNYSIRGQTERRPVRSHKIQFLQWVAGCLIRGGLPAMNDDAIFLIYRANPVVGLPHRPSPSLNQPSCRRASF